MPLAPTEYESSKVPMVDEENLLPYTVLKYGEIKYTLGHQIARGGYSTVYKGHDAWGNSLAIKAFNEKAHPLMWKNEVANYFSLPHPQIVYMYGAFELEGVQYIALEHAGLAIGRINLSDPRERRLILMLTAKCMCEALYFMHRKGFVHTDINPGNALLELTPDNRPLNVKLCDLGLTLRAEHLMPGKHKAKWNPSPECIDAKVFGKESPAMDVYSTAQVLMEILAGEELGRFTDEEICRGDPQKMARSFDDPIGEALALALEPKVEDRISPLRLWRLLKKAGYERD